MSMSPTEAANIILWSLVLINSKCAMTCIEAKTLVTLEFSYITTKIRATDRLFWFLLFLETFVLPGEMEIVIEIKTKGNAKES